MLLPASTKMSIDAVERLITDIPKLMDVERLMVARALSLVISSIATMYRASTFWAPKPYSPDVASGAQARPASVTDTVTGNDDADVQTSHRGGARTALDASHPAYPVGSYLYLYALG